MTPERWARAAELYESALAVEPAARGAFLAEACRDDSALRREVESLLAHEQAAVLVDHPVDVAAAAVLGDAAGLQPNDRVGPYVVERLLGAGGMGQVYRARDPKLQRDVALKILPESFIHDPDRLARFTREAHVLASLNHPNIGAIYGFEDGPAEAGPHVRALVLELVDGPTLADRIAHGPIPVDEALAIARQIAEALEAAHEHGIVHRDLKPANIKVREDGTVKVLDFGLAKLTEAGGAGRAGRAGTGTVEADLQVRLTQSPTITSPAMMTGVGMLLGTSAYMSPEQAKGKPADKRSDIWAFGCVLYEMLTGKRAFDGEDVSDTLAAVLRGEPNLSALPASVPVAIRALLDACLTKDWRRRIGDVSSIRFVLERYAALTEVQRPERRDRTRRAMTLAFVLAAVAVLGAVAGWFGREPSPSTSRVTRFVITLPDDQQFTHNGNRIIDVSPDGTRLVYVANRRLYVRSMSDFAAQPIAGTEVTAGLISGPLFAPDGQSIAYWTGDSGGSTGVLKKIPLGGGASMTLSRLDFPAGLTASATGIVAGLRNNTIVRIPWDGGAAEVVATVRDGNVSAPQILPGGDALLFTVTHPAVSGAPDDPGNSRIVVQSLTSGEGKVLVDGASDGQYVPPDHLVYSVGTTLFAIAFDLPRRAVIGHGVPLVEGVSRRPYGGGGPYLAISGTGTLVYVSDAFPFDRRLEVIERTGQMVPLNVPAALYLRPRVSRDGTRIAVDRSENGTSQIWIKDVAPTATIRQLTLIGKRNQFPVWSADGQRITFQSDREGDAGIFWQRADGSDAAERLTTADRDTTHIPQSWSPDGTTLLFSITHLDGTFTLHTLSRTSRTIAPFGAVRSLRYAPAATFSPDGRWVAYAESSDGNPVSGGQVFVQPFPPTGTRYVISRGLHPVWSPDGKELWYHRLPDTPDHMAAVSVSAPPQGTFTFSDPVSLPLRDMQYSQPTGERNWDMMPDGKRLLAVSSAEGSAQGQINVVLNWLAELRQRVPSQ